jgi:hypothetical protein
VSDVSVAGSSGAWVIALPGIRQAFVFQLWVVAKIDQQAKLEIGRAKIIQKLSPTVISERRDRLVSRMTLS